MTIAGNSCLLTAAAVVLSGCSPSKFGDFLKSRADARGNESEAFMRGVIRWLVE